jgi:DNA-binding MarR family transcriptional regulator
MANFLVATFFADGSDNDRQKSKASFEQDSLLGYDLSNDESFWLSQVAEDGSLPSPKDKALADKLKKKGLVDVYERPKTRRDTSLNQVYFVTYRGDAAQRAYQTYRARWAKADND